MDISFNNRMNNGLGIGRETPAAAAPGADREVRDGAWRATRDAQLTITHTAVTREEIAAAEIPESALTRDDPLGDLVGRAFNLPPPPMPDFSRLDG